MYHVAHDVFFNVKFRSKKQVGFTILSASGKFMMVKSIRGDKPFFCCKFDEGTSRFYFCVRIFLKYFYLIKKTVNFYTAKNWSFLYLRPKLSYKLPIEKNTTPSLLKSSYHHTLMYIRSVPEVVFILLFLKITLNLKQNCRLKKMLKNRWKVFLIIIFQEVFS